jgi:hypothetical protein
LKRISETLFAYICHPKFFENMGMTGFDRPLAESVALRVSAQMDSLKKSVQTVNAEDYSYAMAA